MGFPGDVCRRPIVPADPWRSADPDFCRAPYCPGTSGLGGRCSAPGLLVLFGIRGYFQQIPAPLLTQIAVGPTSNGGDVRGIDTQHHPYRFDFGANPPQFESNPSPLLAQIAVGPNDSVWGIDTQQLIYQVLDNPPVPVS